MPKIKVVLNTDPYYIKRLRDGVRVGQAPTKALADVECLRLNRLETPKLPDGSYEHDRVTYVVEYHPEYKHI